MEINYIALKIELKKQKDIKLIYGEDHDGSFLETEDGVIIIHF